MQIICKYYDKLLLRDVHMIESKNWTAQKRIHDLFLAIFVKYKMDVYWKGKLLR